MKTYIYLIEHVNDYNNSEYKIGFTRNNPIKRMRQLQTANSGTLKLEHSFQTEFGTKLETALHNLFSHKRKKNEWFELDLKDISYFIDACSKFENNFKILKNENFFIQKILQH